MTVVSFSMAYRSFRGGSGRLDTHLDTPPSINRRHPDSCLARGSLALASLNLACLEGPSFISRTVPQRRTQTLRRDTRPFSDLKRVVDRSFPVNPARHARRN